MDTRMMSSLRTMIYSAMFLEGTYVASFQLGRACYLLIFLNFEKRMICKLISGNVSHMPTQEINCVFVCTLVNFQHGGFFGFDDSQLQAWLLRLRSHAY